MACRARRVSFADRVRVVAALEGRKPQELIEASERTWRTITASRNTGAVPHPPSLARAMAQVIEAERRQNLLAPEDLAVEAARLVYLSQVRASGDVSALRRLSAQAAARSPLRSVFLRPWARGAAPGRSLGAYLPHAEEVAVEILADRLLSVAAVSAETTRATLAPRDRAPLGWEILGMDRGALFRLIETPFEDWPVAISVAEIGIDGARVEGLEPGEPLAAWNPGLGWTEMACEPIARLAHDDPTETLEGRGYAKAREAVLEFGSPDAYSAIRKVIAERPFSPSPRLDFVLALESLGRRMMLDDWGRDLGEMFYEAAPDEVFCDGEIWQCLATGSLLSEVGGAGRRAAEDPRSPLSRARLAEGAGRADPRLQVHDLRGRPRPFVLRAAFETFWGRPGRDEMRLAEAIRERLGTLPDLWPDEDLCDLRIAPAGARIDIDVKSQAEPRNMARGLRARPGHKGAQRLIVAIPDDILDRYRDPQGGAGARAYLAACRARRGQAGRFEFMGFEELLADLEALGVQAKEIAE